jgi:xanthine dehydrogenase large subunit
LGHIIKDQDLLAEEYVEYIGQPIAFVVAENKRDAFTAIKLIELKIEELDPITSPRKAYVKGELIQPERVMLCGDIKSAWNKCETIVEGRADSGGQEHFYLETQGALSVPIEGGKIKVHAGTQAPGGFHHSVSEVLDMPMHMIEIDIRRLGGAFGGKESCALWTVLSAMGAKLLKRPVKIVLNRAEDIATTPKRHPFSSDYKLGIDKDGKILAYEVKMFQNAGAFADISLPVLERALLHAVNSYRIPNVKITMAPCKTNTIPNGAFRGFGAPQAIFVIESAIYKAASELNIHPSVLQKKNLLTENDQFPFGMKTENCTAARCWEELDKKYDIDKRIKAIENFNKKNTHTKKGIAIQPVCFGISFTQTALNQAGALVHLYTDGSVAVSTGAVEMGQGVNMKILQIVAQEFSVDTKRVKLETTNTTRVANASPTAASSGADLNGMAAKMAANKLLIRLKKVAVDILNSDRKKNRLVKIKDIEIIDEKVLLRSVETDITWESLINSAYWARTDLSCHAYYATPKLHFDREKERGRPFAYHSYGTSITEVTLDCIRGTYYIDSVKVVHDVGKSLNSDIDRGQFEGGLLQGVGWTTIENLVYADNGALLSSTNSYKIPDIKFGPKELKIDFLEEVKNPYTVYNSKAVGEPPLLHGIGAYFALLNALDAARPNKYLMPSLPITPEKAFMYIYE